jgi:DNA-binding PadR family transcriptional regulator
MPERELLPGEYAVLALLRVGPTHGYELARCFAGQELSAVCPIEPGLLYTYLRNVEERGLVTWEELRVGKRPPRKLYRLSETGVTLIDRWLQAPVERMREVRRELLVKLYVLHLIAPEGERELLRGQVVACERYIDDIPDGQPKDSFLRLVNESKRAAAEGTLEWLRGYERELDAARLSV